MQAAVPVLDTRRLQVGNLASAAHDRAHFGACCTGARARWLKLQQPARRLTVRNRHPAGAWAIISAPLYLSFDLRSRAQLDRVWPLVTNREALAVNQNWSVKCPVRTVQPASSVS